MKGLSVVVTIALLILAQQLAVHLKAAGLLPADHHRRPAVQSFSQSKPAPQPPAGGQSRGVRS